jgi:hypothetical protein
MSLEQYKDANRKELWEILQIQVERIAELEKERAIGVYHFTVDEYKAHNLEQQAKGAIRLTNVAMKKLQHPKCSQSRLEYFKAGVRALAFAIDKESETLKETK